MFKQLTGITAMAACLLLPATLQAQKTGTLCNNGTVTYTVGERACSTRGGVNKEAQEPKTAVDKTEAAVSTAAENTGKAVKKGGKQTGDAVSHAAEQTGKVAKKTAIAIVGDNTNQEPTGAIAKCKDGSYSHLKDRGGACTDHGGVDAWLDGKP